MLALEARRMGYRVHTLSPDSDTPTGQVSDVEINASYNDLEAVRSFARRVSVVTFEFENVPAPAAAAAAEFAPVRPSGAVLHTTQHRLREKTFLAAAGLPVTPFRAVRGPADLAPALAALGLPAVLKTAGFGYDGKGQARINTAADAEPALAALGGREAVLEAWVDFEREVSVLAARGLDGAFAHYGVIDNTHRRHVLDLSIAPAPVTPALARQAVDIARTALESLDVIGVMCVFF